MKKLLILALLFSAHTVLAQDYCKQIKKDITENNTNFNCETPYNEDAPPLVRAVRSYSTDPKNDFDNFNLILSIPCEFADLLTNGPNGEVEKEEVGVIIEFSDKSKIEEPSIAVTHDKKGDGSAVRVAYLPIDGDNVIDFTKKKIVKIQLAKTTANVPDDMATAMQKYMACLRDAKKI